MTTVYLVRHAHADWQPDENRPLSTRGAADAAAVARLLSPFPIGAIYSSPSRRTLQTIGPLAEQLKLQPIVIEDLRERELAAPTAEAFFTAVEESWRHPDVAATGGESNIAGEGRGLAVLGRVLEDHQDELVAISTHGSLFALILHGLDARFGYDFWRSLTFPDVYELAFDRRTLLSVRRIWPQDGV